MPSLSRITWHRFEPRIGNNTELPVEQRFFLEVARGLTKEQLKAFGEAFFRQPESDGLTDEQVAALSNDEQAKRTEALKAAETRAHDERVAELKRWVRFGSQTLVVDGQVIENVGAYLDFFDAQANRFEWLELARELYRVNSITGNEELFSARPSGGSSSTADQSTARGAIQKAVH